MDASSSALRRDGLARGEAAQLVEDMADGVAFKRGGKNSPVLTSQKATPPAGREIDRAYVVALLVNEHGAFRHRAGGDDADNIPVNKPLGQRGILHLLTYGDRALGDEPRDIRLGAVIGHAAHGRALVGVFNAAVTRGEGEVKLTRGELCILVEHLIKIAQTEKQQAVLMLLLYFIILPASSA